jgi:hypothetical protein
MDKNTICEHDLLLQKKPAQRRAKVEIKRT